MRVGDKVHIDTDNRDWGRVASDGTVLEIGRRDALVNAESIRANIRVPLSDISETGGGGPGEAEAALRDMDLGRIAAKLMIGAAAEPAPPTGAGGEHGKCTRCGGGLEPGGRCTDPKCPLSQRADPAFWPWRRNPPTASRRAAAVVDDVLRMIYRALDSARYVGFSGVEMGTGADGQRQVTLTTGAGEGEQKWVLDAESILEADSGSDAEFTEGPAPREPGL